jgi:predicted DNA-binding ribbon-helix-helix protein
MWRAGRMGHVVHVSWYTDTMVTTVERVQTGIRIEKRILKVLKAMAEVHDMSLGDLIEGIVLHAFEGKAPFGHESLKKISELRKIYGLTLSAADSHKLIEEPVRRKPAKGRTS